LKPATPARVDVDQPVVLLDDAVPTDSPNRPLSLFGVKNGSKMRASVDESMLRRVGDAHEHVTPRPGHGAPRNSLS